MNKCILKSKIWKLLIISYMFSNVFLFVSCSKQSTLEKQVETKVQQMSETSELTTVEYTVTKVIKADDNPWYKIGERKILFTCTAYLKAGIDMSSFSMERVDIDGGKKSITIELPHAELQSINIPPDQVKMVYQKVDILRKDFSASERAMLVQQGEKDILADVNRMGILTQAEKNAEDFFTVMFHQMGFDEVKVKFYLKNEKSRL